VISIQHRGGDMVDFECRRVAKYQQLHQWWTKKYEPSPLVSKNLDELLDQHLLETLQH
jgi:hypothetical protein